jgi:hypothetical protein
MPENEMDAGNFQVAPSPELEPWAQEALAEQSTEQEQAQADLDPQAHDVLYFQIPALEWADEVGLAEILLKHPNLHEQIIATAAGFHGNTTVLEALEIERQELARSKGAAEPQEELTPPAVVETQAEDKKSQTQDGVAPEPKEQEAEPGWVVRARAFNSNHEDQVNLFNIATGFAARDTNGSPDPAAIARWQAENGIEPDGRIGQDTADRAWQMMPVEQPKQEVYTLPDDIPPPQ